MRAVGGALVGWVVVENVEWVYSFSVGYTLVCEMDYSKGELLVFTA